MNSAVKPRSIQTSLQSILKLPISWQKNDPKFGRKMALKLAEGRSQSWQKGGSKAYKRTVLSCQNDGPKAGIKTALKLAEGRS